MERTEVAIVGAGQAGLAMSRCLHAHGIEHLVLERGLVAERWRSERWDSMRLLTPNWMTRLPGHRYRGDDPDGFMHRQEVVALLEDYARSVAAPLWQETTVRSIARDGDGYRVQSDRGELRADNVVIATGACQRPLIPQGAAALSTRVERCAPSRYRRPSDLPDGGVLVVGASATGVQLADELRDSGRPVVLAVGAHMRMPRRYRGRDIMWWLDRMGSLDRRPERFEPSLQLSGRSDRPSLDLRHLQRKGVQLVGRLLAADGERIWLGDDLALRALHAEARLQRLLSRIDRLADAYGLGADELGRPPRFVPPPAPRQLHLARRGIASVLWATGFARSYPFLHVPVLGRDGEVRHRGGLTRSPGLYVLGLNMLRTRRSTFLDGVGADASFICEQIERRQRGRTSDAA